MGDVFADFDVVLRAFLLTIELFVVSAVLSLVFGVLFVVAGVLIYLGRAKASPANLIPKRTLVQLSETARTIKEQIR